VTWINEDDFVVLVYTVLIYPIGVQYPQVTTTPANTFFRNAPQSSLGFEVVHTLTDGFAVGGTYGMLQRESMD
jgi:hypothetical protein